MNSHPTDELIETIRGILEGKEWQIKVADAWVKPGTDKLWAWLHGGYEIRLKPFVPKPPEGYRLLTEEEKKGQWIEEAQYWSTVGRPQWVKINRGVEDGCYAHPLDHVAVPITPPAPEYVPWTFETFPRDLRWLRRKLSPTLLSVQTIDDGGMHVYTVGFCTYEWLLEGMLTEAGEPCGTIKQ